MLLAMGSVARLVQFTVSHEPGDRDVSVGIYLSPPRLVSQSSWFFSPSLFPFAGVLSASSPCQAEYWRPTSAGGFLGTLSAVVPCRMTCFNSLQFSMAVGVEEGHGETFLFHFAPTHPRAWSCWCVNRE